MSLSNELTNSSLPQALPVMSLPWIPYNSSPPASSYRYFTPQIGPLIPPKIEPTSPLPDDHAVNLEIQSVRRRNNCRKISKSNYKHIPHKEKPPHLVARRNARERKRVQAVNCAFAKLRKCVPIENRNKRMSKVKTLHRAIEYINALQSLLRQDDDPTMFSHNAMIYSRHRSESNTSQEDEDFEDEERVEFNDFEDYLESDVEIVNKENKNQGWALSSGYEQNYWSNVSYEDNNPGNTAN